MLRVYDRNEQRWMHGDFCITSNGDLAELKKRPFGLERVNLLSDARYVWHEDIGTHDVKGNLIFEGDICKIDFEEETVYCVVAYIGERAAYLLFDEKNLAYYTFNDYTNEKLSVVGNVFNSKDILDFYMDETKDGE